MMDFSTLSNDFLALPRHTQAVLACVVLFASAVIYRILSNRMVVFFQQPPVMEDIPFIGGLRQFVQGPMKLMAKGYQRYGEVFTVPVLHKRVTFLIGPHASPHFFKANDDEMSQIEVYQYCVPIFGPGVVYDVDHKVRLEQFKFFAGALQTAKLQNYVPYFVQEAEDYFRKWGKEGVVDLKEALAELIILTASRTLLGREVRENMFVEVSNLFHILDLGMVPISVILPYLPIEPHRNRDKARAQLAEIFAKIIKDRRASGAKENDILQTYIDSKYDKVYGGRMTNDKEITGMLIATLFAGQHTSSITASWTGYFMMANKEATMKPAEDEQRCILAEYGPNITMEVLNKMDVLHRNMTEALRMYPPLIMVLRMAKKAFVATDSKGHKFHIPAGHVVAASPAYSHTLPTVFKEPQKYDPERFAPPREEDKRTPFSFIGFGGGRHGCMGSNFAYLQIKTILATLLRNFEFELVDPFPEPDYESMVVGPKPCRVRYRRRTLTAA